MMNVIIYMNKDNFIPINMEVTLSLLRRYYKLHNFITEILNIECYGDHQESQTSIGGYMYTKKIDTKTTIHWECSQRVKKLQGISH